MPLVVELPEVLAELLVEGVEVDVAGELGVVVEVAGDSGAFEVVVDELVVAGVGVVLVMPDGVVTVPPGQAALVPVAGVVGTVAGAVPGLGVTPEGVVLILGVVV